MRGLGIGVSKCREVELVVLREDITRVEADAVVNSANSLLIMGGGVAGALKHAGGRVIEEEARRHAPLPVGRAAATEAGRLPARYVIHAPTMEKPAMRTTVDKVRAAVRTAVAEAARLGVDTLAFPGMGTGVGGLDPWVAAEAMVEEIVSLAGALGRPRRVLLVAYTRLPYEAFAEAVDRICGDLTPRPPQAA